MINDNGDAVTNSSSNLFCSPTITGIGCADPRIDKVPTVDAHGIWLLCLAPDDCRVRFSGLAPPVSPYPQHMDPSPTDSNGTDGTDGTEIEDDSQAEDDDEDEEEDARDTAALPSVHDAASSPAALEVCRVISLLDGHRRECRLQIHTRF